jgi:hypothetical protein
MGVVNTTYTFTSTDTITSAKMNNIIDETTFTSDAIQGNTLQVVSPGKLAVNAGGITSNELASGAVVQAKLGTNVVGNGSLINATTTVSTSVPTGFPSTKITLNTVSPDTNNNFSTANSRFTPTVSGYYQINGLVNAGGNGANSLTAYIYRNGVALAAGSAVSASTFQSVVPVILFCNGTSDYIELFASHGQGSTVSLTGGMNACLIRSA